MLFMLDADTALYALRGHASVVTALRSASGLLAISAVVHSQLLQGVIDDSAKADIEDLISAAPVVAYGEAASRAYGRLTEAIGYNRPQAVDRMIAAHAISLDATLVTNNVRDFRLLPGLRWANWTDPA